MRLCPFASSLTVSSVQPLHGPSRLQIRLQESPAEYQLGRAAITRAVTCISAGGPRWLLSASERCCRWLSAGSYATGTITASPMRATRCWPPLLPPDRPPWWSPCPPRKALISRTLKPLKLALTAASRLGCAIQNRILPSVRRPALTAQVAPAACEHVQGRHSPAGPLRCGRPHRPG
jgi:hypothetical protein